jgi:hypothetical protein
MASPHDLHALIDRTFEDLAVRLGGVAATEPIPEATITRLVQSLADARQAAHRRADRLAVRPQRLLPAPHPAISAFLAELRSGADRN